jgi:DNA-binding NtrC family response regulator
MSARRVLVVDDEPAMLQLCGDSLNTLNDTEVILEARAERALERIQEAQTHLLITDIRMPVVGGLDLIRAARDRSPCLPVVVITGFPTIEAAVQCVKLGASEYLPKPFDPDKLVQIATRLLGLRVQPTSAADRRGCGGQELQEFEGMVGSSPRMLEVFKSIQHIAPIDIDVIVSGETGTGKELVARAIHRCGPRSRGRFVPVNCSAIPRDLMENDFFGHERGAFTGAHERRQGLFEVASHGTLFLDEIHLLPLDLQKEACAQ